MVETYPLSDQQGTGTAMNRHQALRHIQRIAATAAFATMSLVLSSTPAHAAVTDGTLDVTFGSGGTVVTENRAGDEWLQAIAIQPDGKLVGAGVSNRGIDYFTIARYNPDGSLDTSFGGGSTGRRLTKIGAANDGASAVMLQSDGKVVAAGSTYNGISDTFAVVRYNPDGTPDATFGSFGVVTTQFDAASDSSDRAAAVVSQPDGKVVVAGTSSIGGFAIARYNPNGTLDTTFGNGGKAVTTVTSRFDVASAVVLQPDGKLVAAGTAGDDFALVRYNGNGTLDANFGTGGKATTSFGLRDAASAAVLQSDGKIVVVGSGDNGSDSDFAIARYNSNGTLDTTFGNGGKSLTSIGTGIDVGTGVVMQADGKVVASGYFQNGFRSDISLVRYNTNGQMDPTFGAGGKTTTSISNDEASALALQSDGNLVVAGSSYGIDNDFALARYRVTYPGLVTGTPTRILDTRPGAKPKAGVITRVNSGAPAGTSSVLVNLTVTGADAAGYLTADACTTLDPNGQSNLNYQPGRDIANTSVVSLDTDGTFCIYSSATGHLIVDRQGTYQSDGAKLATVDPKRILDTRTGSKPVANSITKITTGAPAGTSSVLVNLTVTGAEGAGYITADSCSALTPGLQTKSNANYQPGFDIANTAVVNTDPDGSFCIYTDQTTHLLADLQGTYQATSGKNLIKPPARRLIDTRTGSKPVANSITKVATGAPVGTSSVLVNLTMTGADAAGYITADKCSTLFPGPQTKSNANYQPGRDVANTAVINIDPDGSFCIYANEATHLLADLQGIY
jgi:uncharacterized delta-60 repeat protein